MNRNHIFINLVGILTAYTEISFAHEAIIEGTIAKANQLHYQVSLQLDGKPTCGGGILDHQHILTAAHCVLSEHNNFVGSVISIIAGTNNLNKSENPRYLHADVAKIYVPKAFNPASADYNADIAVLKLKHSLELDEHDLKFLTLPSTGRENFVGRVGRIAGFGLNRINRSGVPISTDHLLRYTITDIIDNERCQFDHQYRPITEKQICAKALQSENVHRGVCNGDDGSPLVVGPMVVGVLSLFPGGCTERIRPAIYTRVTSYRDFIKRSINNVPLNDIRVLEIHH